MRLKRINRDSFGKHFVTCGTREIKSHVLVCQWGVSGFNYPGWCHRTFLFQFLTHNLFILGFLLFQCLFCNYPSTPTLTLNPQALDVGDCLVCRFIVDVTVFWTTRKEQNKSKQTKNTPFYLKTQNIYSMFKEAFTLLSYQNKYFCIINNYYYTFYDLCFTSNECFYHSISTEGFYYWALTNLVKIFRHGTTQSGQYFTKNHFKSHNSNV